MTLSLIIRPDAESDMAARAWYEQQSLGLGDAFIAAVDSCLGRIQAMPKMYAVIVRKARIAQVTRFPYFVLYRLTARTIEVLAVVHNSRDPQAWQSRI